ncbi:DEAD/DEAH box helicase family protein [Mycoplasmoides pneumoniae]
MRPYQICATERILEKIKEDNRNSKNSKNASKGGCIWHSTGSGKTLTSFKAVQLASEIDFVDKVLFRCWQERLGQPNDRRIWKVSSGFC